MQNYLLLSTLSLASCAAILPRAAAADPRFTEMDLFSSGQDGVNLGKTWSAGRTIQPGPAAYTGMATLKDGTIGVLYETGKVHPYEKIAFARFNLDWLMGQ